VSWFSFDLLASILFVHEKGTCSSPVLDRTDKYSTVEVEMSVFWEVIVSVIVRKTVHMNMSHPHKKSDTTLKFSIFRLCGHFVENFLQNDHII
jgi:hypothetical protein